MEWNMWVCLVCMAIYAVDLLLRKYFAVNSYHSFADQSVWTACILLPFNWIALASALAVHHRYVDLRASLVSLSSLFSFTKAEPVYMAVRKLNVELPHVEHTLLSLSSPPQSHPSAFALLPFDWMINRLCHSIAVMERCVLELWLLLDGNLKFENACHP